MTTRPPSRGLTEDEHQSEKAPKAAGNVNDKTLASALGVWLEAPIASVKNIPRSTIQQLDPKLESVLGDWNKVLTKMEAYEEEDNAQKIHTPESMGSGDVLTSSSLSKTSNFYDNASVAPIISLFDNPILGRREDAGQTLTTTPSGDLLKTTSCRPQTKIERIRDVLVELLPSQEVTNKLCSFSDCWLLVHSLAKHSVHLMEPTAANPSHSFNVTSCTKEHPAILSQILIYIAICLQQLPHNFDVSQLHFSTTVEARVDKIISTVAGLVTSDDEIVSTINGLECLVLQGLFHTNAGNLRRAWLTFRRAMNIGQLMGLHKRQDSVDLNSQQGSRHLWDSTLQAERFIGLLLGMPAGTANIVLGPHETFNNPNIDRDLLFSRKLVNIAGGIMERNQNEYIYAFARTQDLDEQLESIGREMPASWWAVPAYLDTSDKSAAAAAQYDRIMSQIWYFQLQSFLHLPFMIRAATERRFEYSRFTCLKSSRETIYRYLAMRRSGTKSFCCKVIDFAAFTGCVTLLLTLLESPQSGSSLPEFEKQKASDRELVETVIVSMEEYAAYGKDLMAKQSVDVMKALLAVNSSTSAVGNIRLTIPYFGTISIARTTTPTSTANPNQPSSSTTIIHSTALSSNYPNPTPSQNLTTDVQLEQPWSNFNDPEASSSNTYAPVISFKSSQFPPAGLEQQQIQDWGDLDADTMFFDSLLNTDLEGNWIF
ncbi:Fungal transcriptional regulatory N-terminal protein [Rutstroemia sp. NJR-2017a BBW]|nr:Fungal transcriptional regulatory N-terminal protein [Rutstroemia sp. NJR-2017a BBW]